MKVEADGTYKPIDMVTYLVGGYYGVVIGDAFCCWR